MNTLTKFYITILIASFFALGTTTAFSMADPISENTSLVTFEAHVTEEVVELVWEFNNQPDGQVLVERSDMNMKFETIGQYQSATPHQFQDLQPQEGISFYRLAIHNADGTVTYHKAIMISY